MASIYKRSGVWHVYYRQGGKRVRYSLETRNERVAKDKLKKIEYELMTGQHIRPQKTSVIDFLSDFLLHLESTISYRHYRSRRSHLRMAFGDIIPELTDHAPGTQRIKPLSTVHQRILISCRFLEDITPSVFSRYLDDAARLRNWAPRSYNRARETLHAMFEYAIRVHEYISPDPRYPNPVGAIPRRTPPAADISFLEQKDIMEQLSAVQSRSEFHVAVAVMIYAGLRRGEIVWLTKQHVDMENRVIRIRPKKDGDTFWQSKTKTNRVIPISQDLYSVLLQYKSPQTSVWYLPAPKQKISRWDQDNLSRMLRQINGRKGLAWKALDFRHTFGSHLAMNNVSLYKIATLMGNSPEICRKHYAALIPEQLTDCVELNFRKKTEDIGG